MIWKLWFKKCCWNTFFSVHKTNKKKYVWYHGLNDMFQCSKNINMCLVCVSLIFKKADTLYKIKFFIWREKKSILYCCPFLLTSVPSFSLLFLESRKPNPHCRSLHLHWRNRRSTTRLHVPWISSPLLALQDLAMNQDFLVAEANERRCQFNTDNSWACCKSRFESHFQLGF